MIRSMTLVAIATTVSAAALSAAQIQVQVDGNAVVFHHAQPQYINGRVLVPLRGVFEELGARVVWNQGTHMVRAYKGSTEVDLRIGDYNATVNGTAVALDVPAMVVDGSTMVPIRFVSEALGAQVGWMEAQQLVSINTATESQTVASGPRRLRRVIIQADEVIPVTLDHRLSTATAQRGDTFTATVRKSDGDDYADIPRGTKIEGHVAAVHGRSQNRPSVLDLRFDRMLFPSGREVRIDGNLTSLEDKYVSDGDNGRLVVRRRNGAQDERMVYAGYGAGAGLLVGVLDKRPIEGAVLGGALGYILGQIQQDQHMTQNITLPAGTEMGVRVDHDIAASW